VSDATSSPETAPDVSVLASTIHDEPIVDVVASSLRSIVTVTSTVRTVTPFGARDGESIGTGFVVGENGLIVTNQHVVEGASSVTVTLSSGDRLSATVVAEDRDHDLVVLDVDGAALSALPLGSSDGLKVGETVVAIGHALDLDGGPSVTAGIVSSLDRAIDVRDATGVRSYEGLLQTDAALNHGNSGGPLLTLDGRVVGVNVAGGEGVENIGFAIPIDAARLLIEQAAGTAA
jgi:S1-C subfamily serine protease